MRYSTIPQLLCAAMSIRLVCLGAVGLGSVILTIADRERFFGKHGVEVELTPVTGTQVPDLTDTTPMGYIGAPAALMRAAAGKDIKSLPLSTPRD